jgi:gliding motility-associated-like protein
LYGNVNAVMPGHPSIVIEFIRANTYTVTATMNTPSGPYTTSSSPITVANCPMPDCKGVNTTTTMAGFTEDFGVTTVPIALSPSRGTTQFTTNTSGGTLNANEYCIHKTTDLLNPNWVVTGDHTRNTDGAMLIVNADAAPSIFYRRQVTGLCKGAVYKLGAWVRNIDNQNYFENSCPGNYSNAGVTFEVLNAATNTVLATFNSNDLSIPLQPTPSNNGWQQMEFSFKTIPGVTDVIVQLRNNNPGGCGNDIAIDDISFAYCTPYIYSFFDGQMDQEGGEYTMCAGSPTNLTSQYTPTGYFNIPHYFWQYSYDSLTWTTISGDGDGVAGTNSSVLNFVEGARLLEGDPVLVTTIFFRLQIYEDGNTEGCAAPSKPIKVTLLPNPKVVVPDNEICIGDTATLSATGGFDEYVWDLPLDTVAEQVMVSPTETSIYTVTGYKSYGAGRTCSRTGAAVVIVDDKPVLDTIAGPSNICLGEEVTLSIPDSLALYDVQWMPTGDISTLITHTPTTAGTNTYAATVTNGMCVVTATRDILVNDIPVANAGADTIRQCNDGDFTMAAVMPAGETGKWSIIGPANGAVIARDDDPMTPINGLGGGQSVTLVWSVSKTSNSTCVSTDTVVLINVAVPISSLAGPDQSQCGTLDVFTMAANAVPAGATGAWRVEQGTATIADPAQPNTTVTVTGIQDVLLSWTISNAICSGTPDTVLLSKKNAPGILLNAIPPSCNSEAVFTLPYGSVSDNPTLFNVRAAATNAMPGFVATADSALAGSPLRVSYPAATPEGTYDFILNIKNGGPGCATDVPFTVSVVAGSVAADSATADRPELCAGSSVTLTVEGGTLGTGANWIWYADNCGGASIGSGPTLTTTVTKTTTYYVRAESAGACSATSCVSVVVTVVDQPPVVTFTPPALTVECKQGRDYTTLFGTPQFSHLPYRNMPLTITFADLSSVNGCDQTIIRTWTATDQCGFSTTASQTITIVDKSAPIFTTPKPADVTVNCDAIPAVVTLDAVDSCYGAMSITPVETRQAIAGACASNYQLLRTWTATDPCGNTATLVQTITVQELTPPVFTTPAPADIAVDCGNVPPAVTLTATEFCTGNLITATSSDERQDIGGGNCTFRIVRTWVATDDCGNSSRVTQNITVQDTTRPVFVVPPPADVQVNCDAIPAPADNVSATDNCGSVRISRTQIQEPVNIPGVCGAFRLTRIWTATDDCGNSNEARQVITVYCDGLPRVALGNDTILCNGESIRLRADGNDITATRWSDGSTGPALSVSAAGTYSVTVTNKCGTAADEVKISFKPCDPAPTFANAFSPNGDGNHDRFRPVVGRGLMLGYQLRIYTRWGQLIYADADPKKGWDGSLHGGPQANIGTYIWWVSYKKEAEGAPIILSGIVNVLR